MLIISDKLLPSAVLKNGISVTAAWPRAPANTLAPSPKPPKILPKLPIFSLMPSPCNASCCCAAAITGSLRSSCLLRNISRRSCPVALANAVVSSIKSFILSATLAAICASFMPPLLRSSISSASNSLYSVLVKPN